MIQIIPDGNWGLTQWDVDRYITINGLDELADTEIHIASDSDSYGAYVVLPESGDSGTTAVIPNIVLTYAGMVNIYVYQNKRTIYHTAIPVTAREKPDDYIYTPSEVDGYIRIKEEEAKRQAAEAMREAAEAERVSAEADREVAEDEREAAEAERVAAESERVKAEAEREEMMSGLDEAEAARASAELQRQSAESMRASAESARVTAENLRAAAETERVQSEQSRVSAESTRASAEADRQSAETERGSAEEARAAAEQLRVTAEQARGSAETARVSAENSRVSAEALRASAENARISAEDNRVSAESARTAAESQRETSEDSRVSAESARVAAENKRVEAETLRAAAETARASAETARATTEAARAESETGRVDAEQERVNAEAARVTAEAERADRDTGIVAQATAQATAAESSASSAAADAERAETAAATASGSAGTASAEADKAAAASVTAQSWAVGGTGTREGEDTDNAKYWSDRAAGIAGGDYAPRVHTHTADDITSGVLSVERLPTIPVTKGGTGAETADEARANLGAAATAHSHIKADITDFPATMPPAAHTHSITDITDYTPEPPPTLVEGNSNGTVNYNGTDVPVHGLGSAAYTESAAYDSAGSASAVNANLSVHISDKANPHGVTAAQAGAAEAVHTHVKTDISDFAHTHTKEDISNFPTEMPPSAHTHNASDINAGTLDAARLPVVPVDKGGTGAATADEARASLGAEGKHTTSSVTLTASGWSSNSQTISVSGMTATLDVVVSPAPDSYEDWGNAGVFCSAQGAGTLTFSCKEAPSSSLTANLLILKG